MFNWIRAHLTDQTPKQQIKLSGVVGGGRLNTSTDPLISKKDRKALVQLMKVNDFLAGQAEFESQTPRN